MSTLTKLSATPYTGPAPTNREPFVPVNVQLMDARGAEIAVNAPRIGWQRLRNGVEHGRPELITEASLCVREHE